MDHSVQGDPSPRGLGWVDLDLGCSKGRWAVVQLRCCPSKTVEHPKSKSTQTQAREEMGHPVHCMQCSMWSLIQIRPLVSPTVPILGGRPATSAARVPRAVPVAAALRQGRHLEGLRGHRRAHDQAGSDTGHQVEPQSLLIQKVAVLMVLWDCL